MLKGIVSDFNNIFLWHKSEDINKKKQTNKKKKKGYFQIPKFQLIQILRLQVRPMHDYVH